MAAVINTDMSTAADREKPDPLTLAGGPSTGQPPLKVRQLPHASATALLGVYSREIKIYIHTNTSM